MYHRALTIFNLFMSSEFDFTFQFSALLQVYQESQDNVQKELYFWAYRIIQDVKIKMLNNFDDEDEDRFTYSAVEAMITDCLADVTQKFCSMDKFQYQNLFYIFNSEMLKLKNGCQAKIPIERLQDSGVQHRRRYRQ